MEDKTFSGSIMMSVDTTIVKLENDICLDHQFSAAQDPILDTLSPQKDVHSQIQEMYDFSCEVLNEESAKCNDGRLVFPEPTLSSPGELENNFVHQILMTGRGRHKKSRYCTRSSEKLAVLDTNGYTPLQKRKRQRKQEILPNNNYQFHGQEISQLSNEVLDTAGIDQSSHSGVFLSSNSSQKCLSVGISALDHSIPIEESLELVHSDASAEIIKAQQQRAAKLFLLEHLRNNQFASANEKTLSCKLCNNHKLYVPVSLERHIRRIHLYPKPPKDPKLKERPFVCEVCGKRFTHAIFLARHFRTHTGEKPFPCDICGRHFSDPSSVVKHKLMHTGEMPYVCSICTKGFICSSGLKMHERSHMGKKPYSCQVCYRRFSHSTSLLHHMCLHTGVKNTRFDSLTGREVYDCELCGNSFTEAHLFSSHMKRHTKDKKYSCQVCTKKFFTRSSLVKHSRSHTGEKPYVCKVCNKGFNQSYNLVTHMVTHSGEKPHSCKVCNKSFSVSSNLKRHMLVHTKEKPYSCETCGKMFAYSDSLIQHIREHTGERPYICNHCGRSFISFKVRKTHMQIHTRERQKKCEICNKIFSNSESFTLHQKCHNGDTL